MTVGRKHRASGHSSPLRRIGYWLSRLLLGVAVVISFILVAAFSFEQSTLRPLAEHLVEQATGRAFSIDGELDARAGRIVSLRAGQISLANADWGSRDKLLIIDEVEVSIDLFSALKGVFAIDNLLVSGVDVLVEQDEQGRSNWEMGTGVESDDESTIAEGESQPGPDTEDSGSIALPVIRSQLSDIDITIVNAALPRPLNIRFDSIAHGVALGNELRVTAVGAVDERPVNLKANIGPLTQLLDAGAVNFGVDVDFESISIEASGQVDQLLAPRQATLQLLLDSPEISQLLTTFDLPIIFSGPTRLEIGLTPSGEHHQLEINASVDTLKLNAQGRLQALDSIDGASIALTASGPDLAAAAKLAGLRGLPAQAFKLQSSASLSGQLLTLDNTRFDTGNSHLTASGSMAQFPNLDGTNLDLQLVGANYLDFAELLGVQDVTKFEPQPFKVTANLKHSEQDQQQFNAQLAIADIRGKFSGRLTANPDLVGSKIDYLLEGQNEGLIQQLLGRPTFIEGNYKLEGDVTRTDTGFGMESATISIGKSRLKLSGKIGNSPLQDNSELSAHFQGPDLKKIIAFAGYSGFMPAGSADITTSMRAKDQVIQLGDLSAQLGRNNLKASGMINLKDGINGSRVEITLAGADIVDLLPPELHEYVDPKQAFELTGSLAMASDQLAIKAVQANLGELLLKASGIVSLQQPLTDTALKIDLKGPDLAAVVPEGLVAYDLPAAQFSVVGGLAFTATGVKLDSVKTLIGPDSIELSGLIPLDTPTDGLKLTVAASGPNLAKVVPIDHEKMEFANQAYEVTGDVELSQGVISLRQFEFSIPPNRLSGELLISLENPLQMGQFDLKANGPNLANFVPSTPRYSPAEVPFDLDALGSWDSEIVKIERGKLTLDDSEIELQGEVDLPPNLKATHLQVSIRGDDLADFGQFDGLNLPQDAFSIDATLQGDSEGLEIPDFDGRMGDSDFKGSLKVLFTDKPDIKLKLESKLFDLAKLLPPEDELAEVESKPEPKPNDGRVIPEISVPASQLNSINFETRVRLGELRMRHSTLRDIEIDSTLREGELVVSQLTATATQGRLNAHFQASADGDRLTTRGKLVGNNIVLGKAPTGEEGPNNPEMDLELEFDTEGATTRELAANLDGFAQLSGGKGRLENGLALGLFGSFFSELVSMVNPFVTREPYTSIACFGAYAEIVDGVAKINPGAVLQTDKLDMFAQGEINLNNEKLGLRFDTSARSGLGVSLGDFVNPFVGVSGTLASPGLGVDPEHAMFEGGFAVATGGISVVAKSLYGRWFGEKDPCGVFKQKAEEFLQQKREAEQQKLEAEQQKEGSEDQ